MSTSELRLSDHFPRVESKCTKPAKVFFECFYEASKMKDREDAEAGRRGLAKCLSQMEAYDKCMVKATAKKPVEMYRVQEEYRVRS